MKDWKAGSSCIKEFLGCSRIHHAFKAAATHSKTNVRHAIRLPWETESKEVFPLGSRADLPVLPRDLGRWGNMATQVFSKGRHCMTLSVRVHRLWKIDPIEPIKIKTYLDESLVHKGVNFFGALSGHQNWWTPLNTPNDMWKQWLILRKAISPPKDLLWTKAHKHKRWTNWCS